MATDAHDDDDDDDGPRRPRRNPLVAAVLSAVIFPGLGQVYCGRALRGAAAVVGVVVTGVIAGAVGGDRFVLPGIFLGMLGGGVDAWLLAKTT